MSGGFKSTVGLYRDCLRLIKHIAGESPKAQNLRRVVGAEFRRNKDETDEEKIGELKFHAVRALSNYLLYEAASSDERLKKHVQNWQVDHMVDSDKDKKSKP
mmetsp:Transcript_5465/g.8462  ORF Transcript_5465/g.8462 Transcript_5465/m.8462 type:complete len:102 (+) Transcript_5465:60-365(+)